MIFLRLILTNLGRHRIRTLISIAGIAFSVAAMLTVVTILQGAVGMFSGLLSRDSQLIVFERNISDLFFRSVPDASVKQIQGWPMVDKANPVLFGIVSSQDHPIITCFGVTGDDARIREATWLCGQRRCFRRATPMRSRWASALPNFCTPRSAARWPSVTASFQVMGIIRTRNGFEDGGVFMPLPSAQSFFHKNGTSSVLLVKLKNRNDQAAFKAQVKQQYPTLIALEDEEFNRSYSQFKILKATAWAVGACGVLLGGLGIANTMIMSVFTRIREIAILRVNGFSNSPDCLAHLRRVGRGLAARGRCLGLVIGACAIIALKLIPALHGYVDADVQPAVVIAVVLLACFTGAAGALYPAFYAMRVRAVEALRFE